MSSPRPFRLALVAAALLGAPRAARATGFTDIGQDLAVETTTTVHATGAFRVRGEALDNLDLDRGLTPSGEPLFPVPLGDPTAQTLTHADMRLRTDVAFYAPAGGVAVKVRFDVLDDTGLGANPDGIPSVTTSQRASGSSILVRRAYGEALTPVGMLVAGRTGGQWGLGILANGGDCADCDGGDAADRVAFITPMLGHIFAVAYDLSATGPFTARKAPGRTLDLDPSDDVRTVTFAVLRWKDDAGRTRRRHAGKSTVEYGAYVSHRWQDNDVPASYLPVASPVAIGPGGVMARGFRATAFDGWFRLTTPWAHIEGEGALLYGHIDQPSLIPGVLLRTPIDSTQFGGAIESDFGDPDGAITAGLDLGLASGDPAPGFGAFPSATGRPPRAGDLDGAQASPPGDTHVDNFRFHPDYRIDRILFREIIGTVTDAVYLRPHVRWRIGHVGAGTLTAELAGIGSRAMYASSTPGLASPLGIELDPTLAYQSRDGFSLTLEHAVLFPLAGLDNTLDHLPAKPAQLVRVRVTYAF